MDGLKQRIIGALVLISLAVIFVPMLFDEPRQERTTQPVDIPEEPDFPEVSQPQETSNANNDAGDLTATGEEEVGFELEERPENETGTPTSPEPDTATADNDPAAETANADMNADETSNADNAGSPSVDDAENEPDQSSQQASASEFSEVLEGAWLVQLGSFGDRENATGMRDRIREAGYDAHLQQIERGGTTLTRVFSGPFASEAMAKEAKQSLDDTFSVNSLVIEGDQ